MKERPPCFGKLDEVFPVGNEGIREVRERCIRCDYRIQCLKEALNTEEGIRFQEEILKRTPAKTISDWIRRWSEKKLLSKRLEEEDIFEAIWNDLKGVLFSPSFFFSKKTLSAKRAFIFGLFTGSVGSMFSLFWNILLFSKKYPFLLKLIESSNLFIFLSFLSIPLIISLSIIFYTGLVHTSLAILGAGKEGFYKTLSVICYSQAPKLFCAIPFAGGAVSFFWKILIQIIGLKHAHDTSYSRVFLALILPFLTFFFLMILVFFVVIFHFIPKNF